MARIYVISGGPGTGKTSVIEELEKRGYRTIEETARVLSDRDKRFRGKSIKEIDQRVFQKVIFETQRKELEKLGKSKDILFSDRGLGDTIAYCKINRIKISKQELGFISGFKYSGIFILDPLDFYEKDSLRQESQEEQMKIHKELIKTYRKLGYKIVKVPFMTVKERADFIFGKLGKTF